MHFLQWKKIIENFWHHAVVGLSICVRQLHDRMFWMYGCECVRACVLTFSLYASTCATDTQWYGQTVLCLFFTIVWIEAIIIALSYVFDDHILSIKNKFCFLIYVFKYAYCACFVFDRKTHVIYREKKRY